MAYPESYVGYMLVWGCQVREGVRSVSDAEGGLPCHH